MQEKDNRFIETFIHCLNPFYSISPLSLSAIIINSMSGLGSFFEKRDHSTKKDSALSNLFTQEKSTKFANLATEANPSNVVYLPPEPKKDVPEDLQTAIFVGNIPVSYKHKDLKKLFNSYGKIEKVWFRSVPVEQNKLGKKANFILKNLQEGADSMNGYVKFEDKQSAEKACEVNGTKVEEHTLRVFLCLDSNLDYETTIFVGNLHLEVREEELRQHFEHIGQIVNVRVIKDKTTFKGIGIGYVRFANKQDMLTAIQTMQGTKLRERPVRVKRAIEKSKLEKKFNRVMEKQLSKKNYTPPQDRSKLFKGRKQPNARSSFAQNNPFLSDEENKQKEEARKFHFKRKHIKK